MYEKKHEKHAVDVFCRKVTLAPWYSMMGGGRDSENDVDDGFWIHCTPLGNDRPNVFRRVRLSNTAVDSTS